MRTPVQSVSIPTVRRARRRGVGRFVVMPARRRHTLVLVDVPPLAERLTPVTVPVRRANAAFGTRRGRRHTRRAVRYVGLATRRTRRIGVERAVRDRGVIWMLRRARHELRTAARIEPEHRMRRRILVALSGAVLAGIGARIAVGPPLLPGAADSSEPQPATEAVTEAP
jgi:hypothetical protein